MTLLPVIVIYDVAGLVLGGVLLFGWRRGASPRWACDVRILLLFGAILFLGALAGSLGAGFHSGFATLRLLTHGLFCVLAPLLMARGLWLLRQPGKVFAILILVTGLAMEATYVYAKEIEPFWLDVTHYEVRMPCLDGLKAPIKIVVLADLQTDHISDYERRVFRTMDELQADLILLPGDYLQMDAEFGHTAADCERERLALVALFNQLKHKPQYGIWGVDGDVDFAEQTFRGSVARPIQDETRLLPGDPPLQLIGLSIRGSRRRLSADQEADIAGFVGPTIVMGHAPDFNLHDIETWRRGGDTAVVMPKLCLAGHVHGGQVVVPFLGPPITLSGIPRRYASGLHRFGAMHMLVTRGVGLERGHAPRIRFNCRPELAVIHLMGER